MHVAVGGLLSQRLLKSNYLEDCTVFEVIVFSDFIEGASCSFESQGTLGPIGPEGSAAHGPVCGRIGTTMLESAYPAGPPHPAPHPININ